MPSALGRFGIASLLILIPLQGVSAGNYGESVAWQFQTTADKVNLAVIQDMIQKRKSGYYAPPVYNSTTNIDRQYNCNVTSSSIGNSGTNSTVANSPSTSGNSGQATGNNSDTSVIGRLPGAATVNGNQTNSGQVQSNVSGSQSTSVSRARAFQVLNSEQTNSGNQTASVSGSTGCAFGALN